MIPVDLGEWGTAFWSRDPNDFRPWMANASAAGLYRDDGIAQHIFRGEPTRHGDLLRPYAMLWLPGGAWILFHDGPRLPSIVGSIFVRPDLRGHGLATLMIRVVRGLP